MKQTKLHALNPESVRKRINAAKSNKPFMAALLDRDHRGHREAVDHWTRLHKAAFPGEGRLASPTTLLSAAPRMPNQLSIDEDGSRSGAEAQTNVPAIQAPGSFAKQRRNARQSADDGS